MAKIDLQLKDLFTLQEEINLILAEKLSILTRYKFSDIKKNLDELVSLAAKTRDELITEYGDKNESGEPNLKIYLDEEKTEINPKYQSFIKDWTEVLDEMKELTYTPISLETIEKIETDKNISVLFSLLEGSPDAKKAPSKKK